MESFALCSVSCTAYTTLRTVANLHEQRMAKYLITTGNEIITVAPFCSFAAKDICLCQLILCKHYRIICSQHMKWFMMIHFKFS